MGVRTLFLLGSRKEYHNTERKKGPGGSICYVVGLPNNSFKPITNTAWVRARLCKLQTRCTRFAAASDKVYQLLAHGRWFSPGTPASSTTKAGRHDIAEILLNVALNTKNHNRNEKREDMQLDNMNNTNPTKTRANNDCHTLRCYWNISSTIDMLRRNVAYIHLILSSHRYSLDFKCERTNGTHGWYGAKYNNVVVIETKTT